MDYLRLASLILSGEFTNVEIARQCGVHRSTVPKYRARLAAANMTSEALRALPASTLGRLLNPPKAVPTEHQFDEPDWSALVSEMAKGDAFRSVLYEDYAATAARPMSQTTFCKRLNDRLKLRGVVMRTPRQPGREVLVDFSGKRPRYTNPESGADVPVELFVASLGYSRKTFAMAVPSQRTEDWIRANVAMMEFFRGVPRYVVPDNLKAAIINPRNTKHGLRINERYRDMLCHYGCDVLPARPGAPRDKGQVENAVRLVQRWILPPLARQHFFSLAELNDAIRLLLDRLNDRPMRQLQNLSRNDLFEAEERARLRPLPPSPFRTATSRGGIIVPPDYHLPIEGRFYSVPHRLVGERVEVFETETTFMVYHQFERVALHMKGQRIGEVVTLPGHAPANHHSYGAHRTRHFVTWGSYQSAEIRKYLKLHLEYLKNPNATEMASKRLHQLMDDTDPELLRRAVARVIATAAASEAPQTHLSVKRIVSLLSNPSLRVTPPLPDNERSTAVSPLPHDNIRGAAYYL
ncbi:IS21 family transposase [Paracoccus denitrificans]|uniref:IS21 family transposase n=1 Tax=Paracoccus denitrificans TaxID=266 RepID=UPI000CECAB08|nr:IS21 family transposase [Paracoccus denitrificans]